MISSLLPPHQYAQNLFKDMLQVVPFNNNPHKMNKVAVECCIKSVDSTIAIIDSQLQGFLDCNIINYLNTVRDELNKIIQ